MSDPRSPRPFWPDPYAIGDHRVRAAGSSVVPPLILESWRRWS